MKHKFATSSTILRCGSISIEYLLTNSRLSSHPHIITYSQPRSVRHNRIARSFFACCLNNLDCVAFFHQLFSFLPGSPFVNLGAYNIDILIDFFSFLRGIRACKGSVNPFSRVFQSKDFNVYFLR